MFLPTALLSPGLSSRWIGSGSVCGVSGLGREMVPGDGDCLQTSQHSLDRTEKPTFTVTEIIAIKYCLYFRQSDALFLKVVGL